jgi:hypothetical protein
MTIIEKATAECDRIGLTDENQRFWFIQGYSMGNTDAKLDAIKEAFEKLANKSKAIPHETR